MSPDTLICKHYAFLLQMSLLTHKGGEVRSWHIYDNKLTEVKKV